MKILKAGIIAGIAGIIVSFVMQFATMSVTAPLFAASLPVWKPMTSPEWALMYLVPLLTGLMMAFTYSFLDKKTPVFKNGLSFGVLVWALANVPGMLMTYSSFAVPTTLVALWMLTGLVQYVVMGFVIQKLW
ncbi:hypothetical protein H0N95_00385 [Candidatus Micrarchaeota archaeon]|nr:hypothetical protein [Candidatus Micrarchaeota archaeon]